MEGFDEFIKKYSRLFLIIAIALAITMAVMRNKTVVKKTLKSLRDAVPGAVYTKNKSVKVPDNKYVKKIIEAADSIFATTSAKDAIITSGEELTAIHSEKSKHYEGLALDIRSHSLRSYKEKKRVEQAFKETLGEDYDVIFHYNDGYVEHYHIEYDPKDK
jgi:hypothetical protein